MRQKPGSVGEWEIRKHMAIELYPMSLEKQQEYMSAGEELNFPVRPLRKVSSNG